MRYNAAIIPLLISALIPPVAALRWQPRIPDFLPETLPQEIPEDQKPPETMSGISPPESLDHGIFSRSFSAPVPVPVTVNPGRNLAETMTPRPPAEAKPQSPESPKPEPEPETRFLGVIRDTDNIVYSFVKDLKSGAVSRIKEEP